jgi:hypothetical protein
MTCLREAPSVRSVASSRTRWATVIDSVLKMTNAPTSSAIPAKPSRIFWKIPVISWVSFASASPRCAAVWTCAADGSSGATFFASWSSDVPSRAARKIASS